MLLTKDNFKLYAIKAYNNPNCLHEDEFLEDLGRIRVIKRQFGRLDREFNFRTLRILVNSVLVFYNVFTHNEATNMLHFKIQEKDHKKLNSILFFLSLPVLSNCIDSELLLQLRDMNNVKN